MNSKLILLRHGQSTWNKLNYFTGWVDIGLSAEGIEEALKAAKAIKDVPIDLIYVSSLIRAQMTAMIVMAQHAGGKVAVVMHPGEGKLEEWAKVHNPLAEKTLVPVIKAWELNERMYGDLQGLNKKETIEQYGKEQVHIWRRSYDVPPPHGECLADTAARAIPYFEKNIVKQLEKGKNVFVCAHGNSLRAIMMKLDNLSKEEVLNLELETGAPVLYTYQNKMFVKENS